MNAPDRYEKFVLPPNTKKLALVKDGKLANAYTLVLHHEDHTVGNLLRCQLHRDRDVVFAGYRIPHPLEYKMLVKCQTNGVRSAPETVDAALLDLVTEFDSVRLQFKEECDRLMLQQQQQGQAMDMGY
jgi:DNA-directed RNA polymerase II subunit RPB11